MNNGASEVSQEKNQGLIDKIYGKESDENSEESPHLSMHLPFPTETPEISKNHTCDKYSYAETIEEEEPLSLQAKEIEMIKQALLEAMENVNCFKRIRVSQNEHFIEKLNNMISMKLIQNKILNYMPSFSFDFRILWDLFFYWGFNSSQE